MSYNIPGFFDENIPSQLIFAKHCLLNIFGFVSASQVVPMVKNPPANAGDAGDMGSIPGSERSPGVGNGNPLYYCCLENFMDRGAWQATMHGAAKCQT